VKVWRRIPDEKWIVICADPSTTNLLEGGPGTRICEGDSLDQALWAALEAVADAG
jgi:hypothetical protein